MELNSRNFILNIDQHVSSINPTGDYQLSRIMPTKHFSWHSKCIQWIHTSMHCIHAIASNQKKYVRRAGWNSFELAPNQRLPICGQSAAAKQRTAFRLMKFKIANCNKQFVIKQFRWHSARDLSYYEIHSRIDSVDYNRRSLWGTSFMAAEPLQRNLSN